MRGSVLPDDEIYYLSWGHLPANEFQKERAIADGKALVYPFDSDQLQPSSYDVKLASIILVPHLKRHEPIDLRKPADDRTDPVDISDGFVLTQGRFVLGATVEKVSIPIDMVGRIEGKSSRARQGLQIHSAGYLDPGFRGNVTLEIVNFAPDPMILWPDILIAQLSFEYLIRPCARPYSKERNHYQDSDGVIGSRAGHETDDPHR